MVCLSIGIGSRLVGGSSVVLNGNKVVVSITHNFVTCYTLLHEHRTDISGAVELLKEGKRLGDVLDEFPSVLVKYHRGLQFASMLLAKPRDPAVAPEIEVFWGASGTGKTRRAIAENPDAYILTKPNGNSCVWFDGYEGQSCIIFDEFYGWVQYDLLLRLLDRYPLKVQTKGGFVEMRATKFVLTSNKPWKEWYPNVSEQSALERRFREFGHITHFNAPL